MVFDGMDSDCDGSLSLQVLAASDRTDCLIYDLTALYLTELTALCVIIWSCLPYMEDEIDMVFDGMDSDCDGSLSLQVSPRTTVGP